ncbi:MAG: C25 family cysteine peptidase [Bacteroidales bacterium]
MKIKNLLFTILFLSISSVLIGQEKIEIKEDAQQSVETKLIESKINNERHRLSFELNAYDKQSVRTPKGEASIISIDNGSKLLRKGYPDLPKTTTSLIIPDKKNMKVKVVSSEYEEFEDIDIAPSKGNLTRDKNPDDVPYTYGKAYEKDAFFPKEIAALQEPYIMRDFRGQTLWIQPFQYNPVTKTLRVYTSMDIEITEGKEEPQNTFERKKSLEKVNNQFDLIYRNHFINYPGAQKYEPLDEVGEMLIISDASYMEAMQDFVDWKTQKGIPTEIVDVEDIGRTAEEIDNYIENYYYENDLAFVMLIGDGGTSEGEIPSMYSNGDSDNAYSYIEGDDHYPELFVGRFSAESVSDVETQVERVIHYERDISPDSDWLTNATGIASQEGPGYDDMYDYEHIRELNTMLLEYTYDEADEFFEGDQGENDEPGDPTPEMLSEAFNQGRGIVNYTGHGSNTSWGTSGFANSDINNLTNNNKLPFIFDVACVNGNFHETTCFAESWMQATNNDSDEPTGAIAIIASTINQSWVPPMAAQNEMVEILTEQYSDNIKRSFGGITMNGCMFMNDEFGSEGDEMTDTWTIFGDPSLIVRTDNPSEMNISHNSALMIGQNSFNVTCDQDGALVSLEYEGEILGTGIANGGSADISFDAVSNPGTMTVTVTAFNKVTYVQEVEVTPADEPYVTLDSLSLDDAAGNDNGEADYGEDISLDVILANVSDTYEAFNVIDTLLSDDPYISITDELQDYGDIAPESNSLVEGAFAFTVADSVPDQHTVNFAMHIGGEDSDANEYTWESDFSIKLNAPKLEIGELTIDDAGENDDGILDPGETADLVVEITNTGHADVAGVEASLNTEASELTVDENADGPYDIPEGETKTLTFTVTADDSTPIGTPVNVNIDAACENDYYKDEDTKQVVIGEIPEYLISEEGTVSTCVGLFYDSGGPDGEYNNDENYTMTFEPATSGNVIKAEFLSFAVESGYDWLKVYNGNSTSDELIGTYDSENQPETILADNTHGSLTFEFYSDNIVIRDGWEAEISCVEMNEVTFTVTDGTEPIENATVEFAESAIETDDQGEAIFVVESGEYEYSVSKTGYDQVNGTLDVSSDIAEEITMNVSTYDITFNLFEKDGDTPINGDITFDGSTQTTAEGSYTFNDVEYELDKPFTADVGGEYYDIYEGTVDVNSDKTVDVIMEPVVFDVTVLVEDQDGEGVQGATVTMTEAKEEATTDADGIAAFQLGQGSYSYQVERAGYSSDSGTVEVTGDQTEYNETAVINIENYDITFNVTDNLGDDIEAEVTLDGETQTATGGSYTFENVEYAGDIPYEVEAEECHPEEGTVHLVADTVMNIELQRKSYEAIINVTDQNEDELSEVEVTIDEVQKETDENGEAVFSSLYKDSYLCYADKEGYTTYEEEIMVEKDSTYHISLTRVYKLKFTVSNKEGEAIEGAEITADSESTVTDSDGEAIMELPSGEYTYTISAEGYKEYEKTTELTSNKTIDVTMVTDETGISKLESEGLKVYPNPASEKVIVENSNSETVRFEIVNIAGKIVKNGTLPMTVNEIIVAEYNPGIYFIRFCKDNNNVEYKMIIE